MNIFGKSMYNVDVLFYASLNPQKKGSFEDYVCQLALGCKKKAIKIKFVLGEHIAESVKDAFNSSGVEWYPLRSTELDTARAMIRVLKQTKPCLIDFHFISPCSFLIPISRLMGARKIIFTDHNSSPAVLKETRADRLLNPLKNLRRQSWIRMIDRFIAVSDFIARRLYAEQMIERKKITTIYNSVDFRRFSPPGDKSKLKQKLFQTNASRLVVSYIGQLIQEKGVSVFLDAAQKLLLKRRDILFVIAGQGAQMPQLVSIVQKQGNTSNVLFLGQRDDIDQILKATDILVCPSVWNEAFGLVIAEAMASGIPVVASRVGGISNVVIDGETGILVPPNDCVELAEAIQSLLEDEEKRKSFGSSGYARAFKYFNIDEKVAKTIDLYLKEL